MNTRSVKALLIEDSEQDALLAKLAMEDSGFSIEARRVDTAVALRGALAEETWDIAFADYSLPHLSGIEAIRTVKELRPELPVVVISGTIGEEAAVEVMKAGAADYIMKDKLPRLGVLVERQLAEAKAARERKAAELAIQERDRRRSRELVKLAEASLAINAADSLEDLLRIGATRAAEIIEAHQCVASLAIDGSWAKAIHAVYLSPKYEDWRDCRAPFVDEGIYQIVCQENKPLRMSQAQLEVHPAWRAIERHTAAYTPMRGLLAAPLTGRNGRKLGLVQISDKVAGELTAEDEAVLVQIAQILSVAVENRQLFEATKKAYEDAKLSNKMKDEFLATLSHELRTPLNAILGHAELLEFEEYGSAEYKESLSAIRRNARAQNELISELLDVSRIITGKLALDVSEVEVTSLLAESIASMRLAAQAKGIELNLASETDAGKVMGDSGRLHQVMWNLLSNAIKFTKKGGKVDVTLKRTRSKIQIDVTDTGEGIEPGFLPYVFERFRQEDGSSTRRYGGLGLGLAIVRHIIELHGGTVHAASAGKGKGATFTVCLPAMTTRMAGGSSPLASLVSVADATGSENELGFAAGSQGFDLAGLSILVVDDPKGAREGVARILRRCGATVECGSSAEEGLWLAKTGRFDVFVFGIGMPSADGNTLVRQVKALEGKVAMTPAIALAAYATSGDEERAVRSEFQLNLAKPVLPAVLVRSIAKLAGR